MEDKFINEREKLVNLVANFNQNDEETNKQFQDSCPKTYNLLISESLDIPKFVQYNQEYIETYKKTKGTHQRKKFEADKQVSQKIAQLYISGFRYSQKEIKRASAILDKKFEKNEE